MWPFLLSLYFFHSLPFCLRLLSRSADEGEGVILSQATIQARARARESRVAVREAVAKDLRVYERVQNFDITVNLRPIWARLQEENPTLFGSMTFDDFLSIVFPSGGPLGRGRSLVLRAGDDSGGNESSSQETMQSRGSGSSSSSSSSSSSELESSFSLESRNAGADEPAKATAVCFRAINALKFAAHIGVRMEVSQSSHR